MKKRLPRVVDKSRLLDARLARVLCDVGRDGSDAIATKLAGVTKADAADVTGIIEVLKTALKRGKVADRAVALQALGRGAAYAIDYAGGVPADLLEIVPTIGDAASVSNKDIRRAALRALADFAPAAGVEVVSAVVGFDVSEFSADEITQTLHVLRACKADEAAAAVDWCAALLTHKSAEVRAQACQVLEWFGEEAASAVGVLAAVLGQDTDSNVRKAAASTLLGVDPVGERLLNCNLDVEERTNVLAELSRLGSTSRSLRKTLQNQWGIRAGRRRQTEARRRLRAGTATLRNLIFLKWYEDEDGDTFHSHAVIRDKWNAAHPKEKVSVTDAKLAGREKVKKGIEAARAFLDREGLGLDDAIQNLEG